jgi:hypothetical protein
MNGRALQRLARQERTETLLVAVLVAAKSGATCFAPRPVQSARAL